MQRWHVFAGWFVIVAVVTVILISFFDQGTGGVIGLIAITASSAALALSEYQRRDR